MFQRESPTSNAAAVTSIVLAVPLGVAFLAVQGPVAEVAIVEVGLDGQVEAVRAAELAGLVASFARPVGDELGEFSFAVVALQEDVGAARATGSHGLKPESDGSEDDLSREHLGRLSIGQGF